MLSPVDNEKLLQALHHLGEADSIADLATRACAELLRLVPGASASYEEVNLPAARVEAITYPDPGQRLFDDYFGVLEQHMGEHPLIRYFHETPTSEVVSWTDLDPGGSFASSPLYRQLYVPNAIGNQIAFVLPAPPGIRVGFGISRDGSTFDRRERALLAALRPHLVHLYRLVSHADAVRQRDALLADDGWSVVLVGDDGAVLASDRVAVAIGAAAGMDLRAGARLSDGPLWSALATGRSRRLPRAGPTAPTRVAGRAPFEARLLRSSIGPHVLWIREPDRVTVQDAVALGLTPRQAEVALLLIDGLTNEQISRRLNIAPGTVRKHLESVFERLGVSTRAAVVGRLRPTNAAQGDGPR